MVESFDVTETKNPNEESKAEKLRRLRLQQIQFSMALDDHVAKAPQFIVSIAATLTAFVCGTALGWTSPVGPQLKNSSDTNYDFPVDGEAFSWIGSSLTLTATLACIPMGFLINIIGRKWTLLSLTVPALIGWGLIIKATNPLMMVIGRAFLGITVGAAFTVAPLYVGEIAHKDVRGTLSTFFQLFVTIGILFSYTLGAFVNVFWLTTISAIVPIVFAVVFIFMPESPTYLVIKDRIDEAEDALRFLRGRSYNCRPEIEKLLSEKEEREILNKNHSLKKSFSRKESIKALIIVVGLYFFHQTCGINAVIFYATDIFGAANTGITPKIQTITIGLIQVVMTFVSVLVADKMGRRVMLILSESIMGLCTFSLGVFFIMKENESEVLQYFNWLPVTALGFFIFAYGIGVGPIPFSVISEVCSVDIKGIAVGIALCLNWFLAFLITKFFSNFVTMFGIGPTFWIFTGFCILGALFVFFFQPETKGKSLSAIQRMLAGRENETA